MNGEDAERLWNTIAKFSESYAELHAELASEFCSHDYTKLYNDNNLNYQELIKSFKEVTGFNVTCQQYGKVTNKPDFIDDRTYTIDKE